MQMRWLQTALVQQMAVDYKYQVFGVYRCTGTQTLATAQAKDTVGDSVIRESTFTDEERSHKELGTK